MKRRRFTDEQIISILAKHRDALHSALNTGVGLATDTLQKHLSIAMPDPAVGEIVSYVR